MCLAVPARIERIDGLAAVIELEGVRREISVLLCPDAAVGQYALVHAGFAISVIDEEEAEKTLAYLAEFERTMDGDSSGGEPALPRAPVDDTV